jgi:hypothetical protein
LSISTIPGRRFVQILLTLFILLMIQDTRSERPGETEYDPAETIFSLKAYISLHCPCSGLCKSNVNINKL